MSETIKNEAKEQKNGFFGILLETLDASLLGSMLIGKGALRTGTVMWSQPVTNFEIPKYYQKEPKFNGVFSGNNLPEIKDGDYLINLDKYKSIGMHWIALYVNGDNVTYFDSFGVEHTPKDIKKIIENKKSKRSSKYLQTASIQFNNLWMFLYYMY